VRTCLKVLKIKRDHTVVCKNPSRSVEVKKPVRFQSEASSRVTTFLECRRVHQSEIKLKEEQRMRPLKT
jgi:hypothetical protein